MNQEVARAQCNSIWSDPGPEAVAGEDQSGSLLEELLAPVVPFTEQQEKVIQSLLLPHPRSGLLMLLWSVE